MDPRRGRTIRWLRVARELSQTKLARKAKIGRVTLARIEAGRQRPTVKTLERVARALGLQLRDLLD